jgi:hypothetical protein
MLWCLYKLLLWICVQSNTIPSERSRRLWFTSWIDLIIYNGRPHIYKCRLCYVFWYKLTLSWSEFCGVIFCHLVWPVAGADLRPRPSICSFIFVCVSQHRWLNAIGQKKAPFHSLAITRDTHNEDSENSSDQAHLFNIWTIGAMDRTSAQGQVKLSWLRRNSFKFQSLCTCILPEVLSTEADLMPRPYVHTVHIIGT